MLVYSKCDLSYADTTNLAEIVDFNVSLNDVNINSVNSEYPLILYKDITYFPLTWNYAKWMDIELDWLKEDGLSIKRSKSQYPYIPYETKLNNINQAYTVVIPKYKIRINGEEIENSKEEYPFINFRGITYFPLTWKNAVDRFAWHYTWSLEDGLKINSSNKKLDEETIKNEVLSMVDKLVYQDSFDFDVNITAKKKPGESKTYKGKKINIFDDVNLDVKLFFDDVIMLCEAENVELESLHLSFNLPNINLPKMTAASIGMKWSSDNYNVGKQCAWAFIGSELYDFTWYLREMSFVNDLSKINDISVEQKADGSYLCIINYHASSVLKNENNNAIMHVNLTDTWLIKKITLSLDDYIFDLNVLNYR